MKVKRFFNIILGLALLLILLPQAAWAAQGSDFVVTGNPAGYTYGTPDGVLTFIADGSYTVSMAVYGTTTTTDTILVSSGVTANITLNSVSIELPAAGGGCAFNMTGAMVNMVPEGANTLRSGGGSAGLQCPAGATLTIADGPGTGAGSLSAMGQTSLASAFRAGIGGGDNQDGGTIIIESGTVTASGGSGGAGIGGGRLGNGGTVEASSGQYGAGIGGGHTGNGGAITIEGGTVNATGGWSDGGAGIGGGRGGNGGTITISGGTIAASSHEYDPEYSGAQDIGRGEGPGSAGSLSIAGTAAVFLKTNTCTASVTATTHFRYRHDAYA
ncbi:MAG: hypothetical protein RBT41_01425 [Clostridia bacterium]|jgi:hypothetical protein|nr:hypothetical protein [Clostridia bacterium]